ncbi:GntR family transcriptional regulator [Nocardioides campestrisoli]|uniref:GntR family transcriptional regulator n=1 Tax=Nocardioides campestrisoli TaxID=2736757 RepID=UPI0015E69736|nr:GntR family transcriptional regulator [Nocardioides campestrisoli]
MTDAEPLIRIDREDTGPPFEQVRTQIAAQVASGSLPAGTRLPPVRTLAADLGLAVNTVARVYKELEADGVVETRGRAGTLVRSGAARDLGQVRQAAADYAALCRTSGLALPEAVRLVEDAW